MNSRTLNSFALAKCHGLIRQAISDWSKPLLTILALVLMGAATWKLNRNVNLGNSVFTFAFVWGVLLAVVYRFANPTGWMLVLRSLGRNISACSATGIWLISESRRWLPGGIWGYTSRVVAAKEVGIPVAVSAASMFLEMLVTLAAAVIVGLLGIAMFWPEFGGITLRAIEQIPFSQSGTVAVMACFVLGLILSIGFRNKIRNIKRKLTERFAQLQELTLSPFGLLIALVYFVAMACLNGLVNQALLSACHDGGTVPVVAMIASTALAWCVGLFAFFSPGGILVREATLAALLLPWLPYEVGFSLAILSRLAQLAAEFIGILAVAVSRFTKAGTLG